MQIIESFCRTVYVYLNDALFVIGRYDRNSIPGKTRGKAGELDYFGEGRKDNARLSPPAMVEREDGGREEEGVEEPPERILELTISVLSVLD